MKKILALCLTVMLVLAMVPVIGVAADTENGISVKAVSSATEVKAGDQFTVDVVIEKNTGFNSLKLDLSYDSEVVKIVGKKAGADFSDVAFGRNANNPFAINYVNSIDYATTKTATFATVTFEVLDDAKVGQSPITISFLEQNVFAYVFEEDEYGDLVEMGRYNVPVTVTNTFVTVPCPHKNTTTTPAVEATCVVEGNGEYKTCNDCGEVVEGSADKALNPNNHKNSTTTPAVEATCVVEGNGEYKTCNDCGKVFEGSADKAIDASNHKNTVVTEAVASTCTTKGHDRYVTCTDCNKIVEGSNEELPLADHDIEIVGAVVHTDTADGYTGDKVCKVCKEVIEEGKVTTAGHKAVEVEAKDATCDEEGHKAHWACSECENVFGAETVKDADIIDVEDVVVAAKGHKLSKVEKVEATAEKDGVAEHYACSGCDKLYKDAEGKEETTAAELVIKYQAPAETPSTGDTTPSESTNNNANNNNTSTDGTAPKTGETTVFVIVAMFVALVSAAAIIVLKKKA